ncbi:unnamed protein product, partial [Ectocarpus fasciculatus]
ARCYCDTQPLAVLLLELLASGVLLVGFCTSATATQTGKRSLKPPGARRAAAPSLPRPTHPNSNQREIESPRRRRPRPRPRRTIVDRSPVAEA